MCFIVLAGALPDGSSPSLVSLTDTKEHASRRKRWNRGFTSAALKEYEEVIAKRATELVGWLSNEKGTVDLNVWFARFTQVILTLLQCCADDRFRYDFMTDMVYVLSIFTRCVPHLSIDQVWWRLRGNARRDRWKLGTP